MITPDPATYAPTWAPPPEDDDTAAELRLISYALRDMAKALDELAKDASPPGP